MLDSHHSWFGAEVDPDACAAAVEPRTTIGLGVQPVDSGQAGQQQAHSEGDGCRRDEDAQGGFTSASERQTQAEPDHPAIAAAEVATRPSRTMTSRSA